MTYLFELNAIEILHSSKVQRRKNAIKNDCENVIEILHSSKVQRRYSPFTPRIKGYYE